MTADRRPPTLARTAIGLVRTIVFEARTRLIAAALSGDKGKIRIFDTPTTFSVHNMWAHARYRQLLTDALGTFVYASEEAEPCIVGTDSEPDLCVLVDPLDTSELAVRGLAREILGTLEV